LIASVGALAIFTPGTRASGNDASPALGQTFRNTTEGIAVRYPTGWDLTTGVRTVVTDPALCFALAPTGNSRVEIKVAEYLPPLLESSDLRAYQPRPPHFLLTSLNRSDADWTTGKVMSFRAFGRVFYVGIVVPARTPTSLRHTIEAILDSLRTRRAGRCRPLQP